MAKNNKKGGVKTAQVNNENAAAAAAAQVNNGTPAQRSNTSSSDAQATIIGVLHDRFYKDENAAEHTGLPQETVDKINEVNAISAAVWMCQEVANGNSKFAATMRVGMLEKIKEIAPTIPGLNIDTTKLLPGKDGTTVTVPAEAVEITDDTKKHLENDAKAQKEADGKEYDVTKMSDQDLSHALRGLMATHNSESIIDNINKAIELWREYKKFTDKTNVEKYDNMKPYEVFQEIYGITGDIGVVGTGIGKWAYFVTASVGTPVPAFCALRNHAYDSATNKYKYTDLEVADMTKTLVICQANITIADHTKALETTDKKEKDKVELHENAINRAKGIIEMMTNCDTKYLDEFVEKASSTDARVRNGVHRVITGIIGTYFGDLSKEKVSTIKDDSLKATIKHYIGYITNLFRDPSNQLTDYNLGSAPQFIFKTNDEIEAEVKAAKDAKKAADAAKAKQKEKDAKKAAKAAAKAEAKAAAKDATKK